MNTDGREISQVTSATQVTDRSASWSRVVTRDDKFFNKNFMVLYGLFDTELAIVKVGGREVFFDPATPGCPLGLVRRNATDTICIRSSGTPGTFATVPADPPERAQEKVPGPEILLRPGPCGRRRPDRPRGRQEVGCERIDGPGQLRLLRQGDSLCSEAVAGPSSGRVTTIRQKSPPYST